MITFIKSDKQSIESLFEVYIKTLSGSFDNEFEDVIATSEFFKIQLNEMTIGYYGMTQQNTLTQFFILDAYQQHANNCFQALIYKRGLTNAFIPTCDQFFMMCGLEYQRHVEVVRYYFRRSNREGRLPNYPKSMLRLASLGDVDLIRSQSADFFDTLYQDVSDRKVYILEGHEIYGFGLIENHRFKPKNKSLRVYTLDEYRNKGVARSIIAHLNDICDTLDYVPVPACDHEEKSIKKVLEHSGFIAASQLVRMKF